MTNPAARLHLNRRARRIPSDTTDTRLTIVALDGMQAAAATYPYGPASKCGAKCGPYTCTRQDKHDGPHAAHLSMITHADSVGATW